MCILVCCRWEKNGEVSREVWLKAGQQGLLGVCAPTELGGAGGDFIATAIVMEEQYVSTFLR